MKYLFIVLFFFSIHISGQTRKYAHNEVYINSLGIRPEMNKNDPEYKIMDSLSRGCSTHLIICDSGQYYLVWPFYSDGLKEINHIWIKKSDAFRVNIKNQQGLFRLYPHPSETGTPLYSFDIAAAKLFREALIVKNVTGYWYYIKISISGRIYEGWVPDEDVCSNPCTPCP